MPRSDPHAPKRRERSLSSDFARDLPRAEDPHATSRPTLRDRSTSSGPTKSPTDRRLSDALPVIRASKSLPSHIVADGPQLHERRLRRAARRLATKRRYSFLGGLVVGGAAVLYFAHPRVVYITSPLVSSALEEIAARMPVGTLSASSLLEQLQLSASSIERAASDIRVPAFLGRSRDAEAAAAAAAASDRPGKIAARANLSAHHPVVMIPGIVSTGLEMWAGHACAATYFRQRLWGTLSMVRLFMLDRECWLRHIELDALDGSDPPGVMVRPAQGFEASDYVLGGYWVWAILIENLADIGYSPSNLWMAAYDWRLPYDRLEARDQFLSRLRYHIEMLSGMHGRKVVVVVHSMGSTVWHYFSQWLTSPEGGALSSAWLHDHVESVVLIGPSTLGAPKALTGLLMGESRDFTYLTGTLGALVDAVLSPRLRRRLMRAFPSTQTLLPMGGDAVWGDASGAPDDPEPPADAGAAAGAAASPHGAFLQVQTAASGAGGGARFEPVMTVAQGLRELEARAARSRSAPSTQPFAFRYSHGLGAPEELLRPSEPRWLNPLATALPYAPNLTYHCLYGVGLPTERAYVVVAPDAAARADTAPGESVGERAEELVGERAPDDEDVPFVIDRAASAGPALIKGVRLTDGDGTIPLVSLGYMCARGWRNNRFYNPSGSRVVTREFVHEPPGGGGRGELSADHVDILGNRAVIADVLQIVAGRGAELSDVFASDIRRISDEVARRIARAHGVGAAGLARAAEAAPRTPDRPGAPEHDDGAASRADGDAAEPARRAGGSSAAAQVAACSRPQDATVFGSSSADAHAHESAAQSKPADDEQATQASCRRRD